MTFHETELDELLGEMRATADDVGTMLLEGLDRPKQISHKGEVNLVTEYDTRAEELIVDRLSSRFPEIGMLAEEGSGADEQRRPRRWIVDPLDGTTNYSHGHPLFAVSIGLEDEGGLAAGVVGIPALGMSAWARRGGGAFCNDTPMRVSRTSALDRSLVATGFPYDRRVADDNNTREVFSFIKRTQGVRRCGAAAVDLVFVARGIYDGFWEPKLFPWDLAAGIVLISEAGGRISDYAGGPCDIQRGWIVASNGLVHDEMVEVIREARAGL